MSLMTIRCAVPLTSRCGVSAVLFVPATAVVGAASAHGAFNRPVPGFPGEKAVTFVAAAGENNRVVVRFLRLDRVTLAREWTGSDQGAELAPDRGARRWTASKAAGGPARDLDADGGRLQP